MDQSTKSTHLLRVFMSLVNTLKSLIMLEIDSHVNLEKHVMNTCKTAFYHLRNIECFHSRGQHIYKFIGTKERVCIRKEFNSQRTGLGHQHGRRFIVLGHQYGRRDVMWKHSMLKRSFSHDVTVAMLVYKTMKRRPCLCTKIIMWDFNSSHMLNFLLFQAICKAADHVTENDLLLKVGCFSMQQFVI